MSLRLVLIAKGLSVVVVLLGAWLAYELADDPYENSRGENPVGIGLAPGDDPFKVAPPPPEPDYAEMQKTINDKAKVWGPLVKKPTPPPPKPDLKKMTLGLKVLSILTENGELKCIISDSNDNTQKVYKKGDRVRELTVSAISFRRVTLSHEGHTIDLQL